jgi:hypothetical protein
MRFILLLTIAFLPCMAYSQMDSSNWMVTLKFGVEEHDKRLFDYPHKASLLDLQPENWGTYNWSLVANMKWHQSNMLTLFAGSGVRYQKATFIRPFNHIYFKQDTEEELRGLSTYEKIYLPLAVSGYLDIGHGFSIDAGFSSSILLYRKINQNAYKSDVFPYTETTFELSNLELTSGINYEVNRFVIGVHTRLVNYQRIDKIIFNDTLNDPRVDEQWEYYNPLRFDVSLSYSL